MKFLMVFIGGGAGSVLRYGISLLTSGIGFRLPVATLLANVMASLCLVVAVFYIQRQHLSESFYPFLIVVGFCGGLSTFSTFSWETFALIRTGHSAMALVNVALNLLFALGGLFWLAHYYGMHWRN
ncbi:MAG: CrcB family protein [Flavobacteriales bacterium]|nr:CrcB family protein [Flavobacteriales bacterium]